ncbi:MAG TPA: hypothetical protein PKL56_18425 [Cyclobacteriaceae bacterium]|nr:hypothetical protein [Cyclobacteriaceae bacterium]HMX89652.1 hypothetical protein [Saprospiraceae bacterium]HMX00909.1 hypothetical protein [Cyclobacteriaceae bacterium]HMY93713.1 hypothetical protein [Cyclobacteriaceae bacterium]HNA12853.1 hypothetical protein [Cyclobacteriaceae bacterium]
MIERIAVETLTLKEISELFRKSLEIAFPKVKRSMAITLKKISRAKMSEYKWIKSYEEFKGAKLNFYCQKVPGKDSPVVSIGMTYRTTQGLILITVDPSNGGISSTSIINSVGWDKWVKIFSAHFCERYAKRIMKVETPTFQIGIEGLMFSDMLGPVRITDTISEGVEEIEFQFKEGQCYGYRDSKSKICYFKTVYSNDMLKRDRLDFKNEWQEPLNQLYQLFGFNS